MDTVEIVIVALAGLALAIVVAWLVMKMIVSGLAARMMVAVRDFIERTKSDRRRTPRDTPDRRNEWDQAAGPDPKP